MSDQPPRVIFFAGSSQVGKTTTLEALDQTKFKTVILSARVPRAELNNPSWQDVIADPEGLGTIQQKLVFKTFVEQIDAHLSQFINDWNAGQSDGRHLVFDRSLWDVCGYTYAFNINAKLIATHMDFIRALETEIINKGVVARLAHFEIDPSIPYVKIPARPPEAIRDECAKALQAYLNIPLSRFLQVPRKHKEQTLEEFIDKLLQ